MAESILFNVAGAIITKLGSLALTELGLLWAVNDELEKLKDTVSTIQAVLHDAEEQQSKSKALKNWVSKLKDAFYDADDLLDQFSYEILRRQVKTEHGRRAKQVCIFFFKSNQIVFALKMDHKIKEIRKKLDAIAADRTQFHLSERMKDTSDELRERQHTHSFICEEEVIGRGDDRKAIVDLLTDPNVREDISIIAIVGIGGLGKTTLAQSVYNDEKITKQFDLKLWVCISEEFDVKIIVEKIIESATNKRSEPLEMDVLQNKLRREIDGKKYLLIMDDVWNENHEKWVNLKRLLLGGAKGSMIVITTRSEQVAKTFDTTSLYSLENLNDDNSWLLFKKMAFKGTEERVNLHLVKIGKEIVANLKGVPLAIRVIGRCLLDLKKSEEDWLSFKDNEIYTLMQQENDITSILKLSYNHLPANLKQCFAYCSLFPKDHEIEKEEVIKLWIAQGFVQPHAGNKPMEDVGENYFMDLLWRSFFQDVRKNEWGDIIGCKMHDLMHDLASMVVENECVIGNLIGKTIDKRTRHTFFNWELHSNWELLKSSLVAKNLRTILFPLDLQYSLHEYELNKLLCNFMQLRTFVLRHLEMIELPKYISKLKHLRYLDLSHGHIEFLPNSITQLYHLETLILNTCLELKELPKDTKKLINLRHLDLDGCDSLTCMPKGLGGLTGLLTMNLFVIAGEDHGSELSELNGLNNLRGSLVVKGLKFFRTANLQKNANCLKLKSGLRQLELRWDRYKDKPINEDERILECLQPHPKLRSLFIDGYGGGRLCNWLSSDYLVHLVNIKLSSCERLRHLPRFDQFPSLKRLDLQNLTHIKYIDDSDSLSSPTFFPSLEELSIFNMPKLKGWWKGESLVESAQKSASLPTFPCLSQLILRDCCQLTSMPWHPVLQSLDMGGVSTQLLDKMTKMITDPTAAKSSSSLSMFELRSLVLERIEDLEFLPEAIFYNLTTLEELTIRFCSNLQMSFSGDVEQDLTIGICSKGDTSVDEDEHEGVVWQNLGSLRSLYLEGIPKLECLPKGLQHVTSLRHFSIQNCQNLMSLPEWIDKLTSLLTLNLWNCPRLSSLPEGMRHLQSLQELWIIRCPKLAERCKKETGEDWPKIAHVPSLNTMT